MRRTYEITADDVDFSLYGDRFEIPPEGLMGGGAGALSQAVVWRDGRIVDIDLKRGTRLQKGDRVVVSTSGGAGFGDPRERASDLVQGDIEQGVIDARVAHEVYGHIPAKG